MLPAGGDLVLSAQGNGAFFLFLSFFLSVFSISTCKKLKHHRHMDGDSKSVEFDFVDFLSCLFWHFWVKENTSHYNKLKWEFLFKQGCCYNRKIILLNWFNHAADQYLLLQKWLVIQAGFSFIVLPVYARVSVYPPYPPYIFRPESTEIDPHQFCSIYNSSVLVFNNLVPWYLRLIHPSVCLFSASDASTQEIKHAHTHTQP